MSTYYNMEEGITNDPTMWAKHNVDILAMNGDNLECSIQLLKAIRAHDKFMMTPTAFYNNESLVAKSAIFDSEEELIKYIYNHPEIFIYNVYTVYIAEGAKKFVMRFSGRTL